MQVRNARNAIMHTSEFKMTEPDFKIYSQSMINLLSDVNISASPRAQHAVANIQRVCLAFDIITRPIKKRKLKNATNNYYQICMVNSQLNYIFYFYRFEKVRLLVENAMTIKRYMTTRHFPQIKN